MEELLEKLEAQIKNLLNKINQLQHDQQLLKDEKKLLQEKHQNTIGQIEGMIARLKAAEGKTSHD